jgi:hypothetical protein
LSLTVLRMESCNPSRPCILYTSPLKFTNCRFCVIFRIVHFPWCTAPVFHCLAAALVCSCYVPTFESSTEP